MSKFLLFPRLIPTLALINVYSSAQIYGNDRETDGGDVANFGTSGAFYPNAQQDESEVISRPPVVVSSVGRQSATLIFFHGMGDQGDGWAELFRSNFQPNLRHLKFVAPNAREMGGMTAWFEHRGFDDPSADEDWEGLNAVTNYAHQLIDYEIGLGIPSNRIFLGGFSQGGPVALYSGLSYPEPLGGILCLSGFLLPKDSLPTQIRQIPWLNMANSAVPIFIGHGLNDPNVPFSVAVSTANALQRFDQNVILRAYQMGHSNCATELDDAIRFIREKAPSA